jgi:hypothetical protein
MKIKIKYIAGLIFTVILFTGNFIYAQTNNFGIGTLTPHQSAKLHLNSTTKGFLIPRMTEAERLAIPINPLIPSPATGLMVYQTDGVDGYYYWDGTQWQRISTDTNTNFTYGEGLEGQVAYWRTSSTLTGSNNLFWDFNDSELGIGTTDPKEKVDVNGGIIISNTNNTVSGNIRFTGSDFEGWDGTAWRSFTSNTFFGSGATGQVTWFLDHTHITGNNNLFWDINNFRLGIGTNSPREALEVNGGLLISSTTMTVDGNIRFTGSDFEGWNGTEWKSFTKYLINGRGERGQVTFWRDTYEVTGDWGLFWDIDNYRLGIGTTTPRTDLDINGAIIVTDITNALVLPGTFRYVSNDFQGWMGTEWKSFISTPAIYGGGQPGQVAIWLTNTPPTLTGDNDLIWDNTNKRLGVKTSVPEYDMDVKGEIMIGKNGQDGQFRMYSEQGATDYEVVINPHASMTMNTLYTLPSTDGEPGDLNLLSNDGFGNMFWQDPTKGYSLFWRKVGDVIYQTGNWALGNNQPDFSGTWGTHLLFGRNTNSASGNYSTILNGSGNVISSGNYNTIFTGLNQTISGNYSTIMGGSNNAIMGGDYSVIFGFGNTLTGSYSTIVGGQAITMNANGSFAFKGAAGAATLTDNNTFHIVDAQFHFNVSKNNADFRIDGQSTDNLFYMKASTDKIGIGTNDPQQLLDVSNGNIAISSDNTGSPASGSYSLIFYEPSTSGTNYTAFSAASQTANLEYNLPTWHGTGQYANSFLVNDGFGNLEWADPGKFAEYLRANTINIDASWPTNYYDAQPNDNHIIIEKNVNFTVNLPPDSTFAGKEFFIKKASPTGTPVTIKGFGAELIDDTNTKTLNAQWEGVLLICDGIQWYVAAKQPKT